MKASLSIILILSVLGLVLFLSNNYEHTYHKDEITHFRCAKTDYLPFPSEYSRLETTGVSYRNFDRLLINKSVDWVYKELIDLPDDVFENYECIESIYLDGNLLKTIPPAINKAINLKNLSMIENKLDTFNFDDLDFPTNHLFENLHFHENQIETVIGVPNNPISVLSLNNNKIKSFGVNLDGTELLLPDNERRHDIENLDLSRNALKTFPIVFYRNLHVHNLNLSHNQLEGELFLTGMNRITTLDVNNQKGNGISAITFNKEACLNLERLDATGNSVKSFRTRGGFNNSKLEVINLGQNHFTSFPNDVFNFRRLKYLYLDNNKIQSVKIERIQENIRLLDLSYNKIKEVINIDYLMGLRKLDLSHNQLNHVPSGIFELEHLETVDLSNNHISSLPELLIIAFYDFENLYLNDNGLKGNIKLTHAFMKLRKLDLSNNDITNLEVDDFAYNLEVLNLSNNPNLKTIDLRIFEKSDDLKEIILIKSNNIEKVNLDSLTILARKYDVKLTLFGEK